MALDPELSEYLAKIYESLRYQQEVIFLLMKKNQALEMALSTRDGFAEVHAAALEKAATPALIREQNALIRALSLEIARLRGENATIADA